MKKMLLLTGIIVSVVSTTTLNASAREGSWDREWSSSGRSNRWNSWRQKGSVLGIKDWKVTEKNCSSVQERIAKRATKLESKLTEKGDRYEKTITRVGTIVQKAEAQSIDTTELEQDAKELLTKVTTYNDEVTELKAKLAEIAAVDCTASQAPDQLQVLLQEARTQLEEIRETTRDIHQYLKETLLPDLRAIKSQLTEESTNETE